MSGILITVYTGDSEHFRDDDPDSVGAIEIQHHLTDGEELAAAEYAIRYLREARQFDVRQWTD